MQRTISTLSSVFVSFCANISDNKVKTWIIENCYIAGGAIFSLYNRQTPRDYDLFFYDKMPDYVYAYFTECFKTEYAISIGKVQLIIKFFGAPHECVNQFDFKHNMYYYEPFKDSSKIKSVLHDFSFLDKKELLLNDNRARDIENVFMRIRKFLDRGFKISHKERTKILKKCDSAKLTKIKKEYKKKRRKKKQSLNNFY